MERSTASFILLDDTWDCIVPIPNNTKHIKSVKKTAYGTVNDDFYSNGYYSSIYYNAAIDEGNSNDLFVSIAWSCAGIRFTLEVGESPHN